MIFGPLRVSEIHWKLLMYIWHCSRFYKSINISFKCCEEKIHIYIGAYSMTRPRRSRKENLNNTFNFDARFECNTKKPRLDWLLKTCLNFKVSKIHSTRRAQISKSPKSLFSCAIQNMDPSNLCCIKLTITLFPQDCNIFIYSFLLTGTFKNASCCTCCAVDPLIVLNSVRI